MTIRRAPEPALPEAAWHGAGVEGQLAGIHEELLLCVHQLEKRLTENEIGLGWNAPEGQGNLWRRH